MTTTTTKLQKEPRALDQGRLNVVNKTRSNLFNWRGQFTPEFVEYLLSETGNRQGLVVDPFCGSGTVLQECAVHSRPVHGFEINPAAYAMSRFFTLCEKAEEERRELTIRLGEIVKHVQLRFNGKPLFEPVDDYRERASNLLQAGRELFDLTQSRDERLLALLTLVEAEGVRVPTLNRALQTACARVVKNLMELPYSSAQVRATLGDARSIDQHYSGAVNLIITSPPYVNVFNYHQNHRALVELLGFDVLGVAASEIGSNRKNRGNRLRTVIQYALDMEACILSMANALAIGGQLALVVGRESNVRGLPILNSKIVGSLVTELGCFETEGIFERRFTNRFGVAIFEDVLLFRRAQSLPKPGSARSIAIEALAELTPRASGDVLVDLEDAIRLSDRIDPSPIFNPNLSI